MQTRVLLGLYPPSNVERLLLDAKQGLFRAFASISALALGPILPLRYVAAPVARPDARELPHGLTLSTAEWTLVDGAVMLAVEPAEAIAELARSLGGQPEPETAAIAPVPRLAGMYVASLREAESARRWPGEPANSFNSDEALRLLGRPPSVTWSGSVVVCWRLEMAEPQRWWDNMRCEEMWRVRLRKGARAGPKT